MADTKRKPPTAPIDDRTYVRRVLIALGLGLLVYIFWELRTLALMLFGAVVVATLFRALADPIRRWTNLSEGLSVAIAIAFVAVLMGGFLVLFGSEVGSQVRNLSVTLPEAWRSFQQRVESAGLGDELQMFLGDSGGGGIIGGIGQAAMWITTGITDFLVVLFGGIFLAAQPRFYRSGAIKLIPPARRKLLGEAMDDSERALRLWLRAQLISMVIVGILTGLGVWLIGVPSALALGLIAGLLEFIPFAGPLIAAVPGILLALAHSPELALWAAGVYILVQQLEGNIVYPMVQQWAVHIPAVVLIFSLIGFGMLFGTIGVIFAAPLTVVTYVLVKRLYVQEALNTPTPIPGED